MSHRDGGFDRPVRRVVVNREILNPVVEDSRWTSHDFKPWQALRFPRQLLLHQMFVVEIEVRIAPHPDELAGLHTRLLRQYALEQRSRPQIERQAKSQLR